MERVEGCTCHAIGLNGGHGREIVAFDWQPDCPIHGLKSEWYRVEGGKQYLDAQNTEAVRLQRLARKARETGRGVCRYCENFIDECMCPSVYGTL